MTEHRWLTLYVAAMVMTFLLVSAWLLYVNQPPPEHHFIPL